MKDPTDRILHAFPTLTSLSRNDGSLVRVNRQGWTEIAIRRSFSSGRDDKDSRSSALDDEWWCYLVSLSFTIYPYDRSPTYPICCPRIDRAAKEQGTTDRSYTPRGSEWRDRREGMDFRDSWLQLTVAPDERAPLLHSLISLATLCHEM